MDFGSLVVCGFIYLSPSVATLNAYTVSRQYNLSHPGLVDRNLDPDVLDGRGQWSSAPEAAVVKDRRPTLARPAGFSTKATVISFLCYISKLVSDINYIECFFNWAKQNIPVDWSPLVSPYHVSYIYHLSEGTVTMMCTFPTWTIKENAL